jgi:uncharacterized SAM-binding protein YcdF (DUF218 family)
MELFLSKLLPLFVYPLGLAIALSAGAGLLLRRGRRAAFWLLVSALLMLWTASTPRFADYLVSSLEWQYLPVAVENLSSADALVVLGGGIGSAEPPRLEIEMGGTVDRIRYAGRLFRAGKAPFVVATGGSIPWLGAEEPESSAMEVLLREWGVPPDAIVTEAQSVNTRENALYTRPLLVDRRVSKVLLVTSALHMPRALATFRSAGIDAEPAPTDFEVVCREGTTVLDFLPDAEALAGTTKAIKEYIGLAYYRWRGWITDQDSRAWARSESTAKHRDSPVCEGPS